MTELNRADIKAWVKNFAQESGLRCDIDLTLEDLIRLSNSRVQWRLAGVRGTIHRDYPIGSEWLDEAIAGQTLSINDKIRQEFTDYLLERVLDTDSVIVFTGGNGKKLKISLQSHWSEPSPAQVLLSQNFPEVRGLIGIAKHLILRLEDDSNKLPSHKKLIHEINTFSTEGEDTKILDLTDPDPWDLYDSRAEYEGDPSRMWTEYSKGIIANASNLVALEAAIRAFRDNHTPEAVFQMLTQEPMYRELLKRDGGDDKFANIHAKAIRFSAQAQVAQEPIQQETEPEHWDIPF